MDHICISGIEPSSVIPSQNKYCKILKSDAKIMTKQVEANKKGWCNKALNYNFNTF